MFCEVKRKHYEWQSAAPSSEGCPNLPHGIPDSQRNKVRAYFLRPFEVPHVRHVCDKKRRIFFFSARVPESCIEAEIRGWAGSRHSRLQKHTPRENYP